MISVSNLTKYYGDLKAVDSINFEIKKGEIVGLLGPNGAGKTTTLRMLTGYLEPTEGEISICGMSIYDNPIEIKKQIGYLPESAPLYSEMVVYDYLKFIGNIQEIPEDKIEDRIKYVVEKCGLEEKIDKKISELSKGYKQRVGLAYAIIHDPEILILDEPTSGLDPNQIIEIRELIRELGKEKTVILSTHILSEVEAVCDRVIIIGKGKILADDKTSNLISGKNRAINLNLKIKANASNDEIINKLKIENVRDIQINDEDNLKNININFASNIDEREKIYSIIKQTDWILYEMKQETQTLENIFQELTREE